MSIGESLFNELKDIAENPEMHTSDELLDLVYELTTEKEPLKILKHLQYYIEGYRLDNDKCPHCNVPLKYIPYKVKSEYQGIPVEEELYDKKCTDCNKVFD